MWQGNGSVYCKLTEGYRQLVCEDGMDWVLFN